MATKIQRSSYKDSYASYLVSCICSRLAIFHGMCILLLLGFSFEGEGTVTFSYGNKNKQRTTRQNEDQSECGQWKNKLKVTEGNKS